MIAKSLAGRLMQSRIFQPGEELLGARNAAEGEDWSVDTGHFHATFEPPHWPGPTPALEFGFEFGVVGRNAQ